MTIEEAIRTQLLAQSAVTAITTTIRADELLQTDIPARSGALAILIGGVKEKFNNFIDGTCDLVEVTVIVSALGRNKAAARALSEAIRTNGTNPGTGLAGIRVTTGDLPFMARLEERSHDLVLDEDGGETGIHTWDSVYTATYHETT